MPPRGSRSYHISNRLCFCGHGEMIHEDREGPCKRDCDCEGFDESILRQNGQGRIEIRASQLTKEKS